METKRRMTKSDRMAADIISAWCCAEYGDEKQIVNESNFDRNVGIAYTALDDDETVFAQVYVNVADRALRYELIDKNGSQMLEQEEELFEDADSFLRSLKWLDFDSMIDVVREYWDRTAETYFFDVRRVQNGTICVKAHSMKEAETIAQDMCDCDNLIDWEPYTDNTVELLRQEDIS